MGSLVLTPLVQAPARTPPPMMLGVIARCAAGRLFQADYILDENGQMILDEANNPIAKED